MKLVRAPLLTVLFLLLCALTAWAHSAWSDAVRYRIGMVGWLSGSVGPCSSVAHGEVTLRLRPGGCGGASLPEDIPSDIPAGEIPMRVPLYPGAVSTDRHLPGVPQSDLDSYLKAAAASFTVPADPATVVAWYQTRIASACTGAGTGVDEPVSDVTLTGIYSACAGLPRRWVEIATLPLSDTSTLLEIAGVVHTPPPRPQWSYVPANVASMTVRFDSHYDRAQMKQWAAETGSPIGPPPWRRTFRDRPTLARFRALVNGLEPLTASANGDLDPRYTIITFQQPNGARLTFTQEDCCMGIRVNGALALDDSNSGLDKALLALAPSRP
jgi:hypothetical protein